MAANESYVQIPPDSTGKKIDTSELDWPDGTTVERQRLTIADDANLQAVVEVLPGGYLSVLEKNQEDVIGQLKRIAFLLEVLTNHRVSLHDVQGH